MSAIGKSAVSTGTQHGLMTIEGFLVRDGLRTWYEVTGDLGSGAPPLVICHGGPGISSDYLETVGEIAVDGRACVRYDQIGCGRSDRRPEVGAEFWTVEVFLAELEGLIEHLGITGGYHLLGHSWGGMLALELAARKPAGLRSLIAMDTFAATATYHRHVADLVHALPDDVRAAIERHEADGTTDSPEYQDAVVSFYRLHTCRARPVPPQLRRTLAGMADDSTVYRAMAGPSEFTMTGTLRDWDITDRLSEVSVPVLLISGRYDEVAPPAVDELYRGLPDASWVLFEESSHMPHLEEPDRFRDVVTGFLKATD